MSAPVRVAALVSGGGTNLQALIDAASVGKLINGELTLVLSSNPDAYALTRAKAAGIASIVIPRKSFSDRKSFTVAILSALADAGIGLVVFAGFMYILSPEFTDTYKNMAINVHPALIPAFCGDGFYGLHVHEKVLESGVKITGATVHFVNEICDGGPIILQKAVSVLGNDTPESLQRRVMEQAEWDILPRAVSLFCQGKLHVDGKIVHII